MAYLCDAHKCIENGEMFGLMSPLTPRISSGYLRGQLMTRWLMIRLVNPYRPVTEAPTLRGHKQLLNINI